MKNKKKGGVILKFVKTIEKKIWSEYFELILSGKKKYELRLADWEINEGDTLVLKEWDPKTKDYIGRELTKKVSMIHKVDVKNLFWPKEEIEKYGFQITSFEE